MARFVSSLFFVFILLASFVVADIGDKKCAELKIDSGSDFTGCSFGGTGLMSCPAGIIDPTEFRGGTIKISGESVIITSGDDTITITGAKTISWKDGKLYIDKSGYSVDGKLNIKVGSDGSLSVTGEGKINEVRTLPPKRPSAKPHSGSDGKVYYDTNGDGYHDTAVDDPYCDPRKETCSGAKSCAEKGCGLHLPRVGKPTQEPIVIQPGKGLNPTKPSTSPTTPPIKECGKEGSDTKCKEGDTTKFKNPYVINIPKDKQGVSIAPPGTGKGGELHLGGVGGTGSVGTNAKGDPKIQFTPNQGGRMSLTTPKNALELEFNTKNTKGEDIRIALTPPKLFEYRPHKNVESSKLIKGSAGKWTVTEGEIYFPNTGIVLDSIEESSFLLTNGELVGASLSKKASLRSDRLAISNPSTGTYQLFLIRSATEYPGLKSLMGTNTKWGAVEEGLLEKGTGELFLNGLVQVYESNPAKGETVGIPTGAVVFVTKAGVKEEEYRLLYDGWEESNKAHFDFTRSDLLEKFHVEGVPKTTGLFQLMIAHHKYEEDGSARYLHMSTKPYTVMELGTYTSQFLSEPITEEGTTQYQKGKITVTAPQPESAKHKEILTRIGKI